MSEGWSLGDKVLTPSNGLAATTWFSFRNFHRAFPEASIDFRISREEGARIASGFLSGQGYLLEPPRQLTDRELLRVAKHMVAEQLAAILQKFIDKV